MATLRAALAQGSLEVHRMDTEEVLAQLRLPITPQLRTHLT